MVPFTRVPFWVCIFDPQPNGRTSVHVDDFSAVGIYVFSQGPPVVPFSPLFWGRVPLLKWTKPKKVGTTEESWYPCSNFSAGGPSSASGIYVFSQGPPVVPFCPHFWGRVPLLRLTKSKQIYIYIYKVPQKKVSTLVLTSLLEGLVLPQESTSSRKVPQ